MTMDLIGKQRETCFNNHTWGLLLELAQEYGWKPAGAIATDEDEEIKEPCEVLELTEEELQKYRVSPDDPVAQSIKSSCVRSGDSVLNSYFYNAGYRMTAKDACALADALERALPDVPRHDALAHKMVTYPQFPGERFLPSGVPVTPFE